ncbi:MAG: aminoacyl-tRNA hydrolase [Clostridia bacterium]|nr:aminoacyl-tRNA hydrolase [Clostridia bacterium]
MANIFELFKSLGRSSGNAAGGPPEYILAGLGNPGVTYDRTRHNTGFLILDSLLSEYGVKADRSRFKGLCGEGRIGDKPVLFLKPQTFMNHSGECIAAAAKYYKIPSQRILVICDDINLPVGRMRIRKSGSDGGQKGLRSIIEHLNTEDFVRIRVGIGEKPSPDYDLVKWVLSRFTDDELRTLQGFTPYLKVGLEKILSGDIEGAMQDCNGVKL